MKDLFIQIIQKEGSLNFARFLELALYHPKLGYYARTDNVRTGKSGDFITSVSVGSLFGKILAFYAFDLWKNLGTPKNYTVLELGAEDGQLAIDILQEAERSFPDFFASLHYQIAEPIPQKAHQIKLNFSKNKLPSPSIVSTLEHIPPFQGLVIGNELLDALPFHLLRMTENSWMELCVEAPQNELCLLPHAPSQGLMNAIDSLPKNLPLGYQTELRLSHRPLLETFSEKILAGNLLFLDYGYLRDDYYDPARKSGTLRTFYKHCAGEEPLASVGQQDITAHVDFTLTINDAKEVGFIETKLSSQSAFLTKYAQNWMKEMEISPKKAEIRQFQTLTHPSMLGMQFHALELSKGFVTSN